MSPTTGSLGSRSSPPLTEGSTAVLRVIQDNGFRCTRQIAEGRVCMVGSAPHHGLSLNVPGVDPTHCMIVLRDGQIHLRDWNSQRGTFLNGRQLECEAIVRPGDTIRIGECRIEVEISARPPATALDEQEPPEEERTLDLDSAIDIMLQNTDGATEPETSAAAQPAEPAPLASLEELFPHTAAESDVRWEPSDDPDAHSEMDDYDFGAAQQDDLTAALQDEIDYLRRELADRDARLAEFDVPLDLEDFEGSDREPAPAVEAVTRRLEQVLEELEQADERIALLTELLGRAEQANRAADEERSQIETWIGEIERLFSAKESEWQAERDVLSRRMAQISRQRDELEQKLEGAARGGAAAAASQHVQALRAELAELQQQLAEVVAERDKLASQQRPTQEIEQRIRAQIEAELREERLKLAEQRAELSQRTVETAPSAEAAGKIDPRQADYKIRAFREHLRELHQADPPPVRQGNVAQRLGKLWRKLNGTPLDTD